MEIEFTTVDLSDSRLVLKCEHTSFINHEKVPYVSLKELKSKISLLAKKCKESNVKLSRKNLNSIPLDGYEAAYTNYSELYTQAKGLFTEIVESGLRAPLVDNEKLNEAYDKRNKMDAMFWRSQILSKFIELNDRVDGYLKDPDLSHYEKIFI